MASEVDICNLALGRLGDGATVASINPAEGSVQAEHCARFYPIARDAVLEMHAWNFATRRATPPLLGSAWTEWAYGYAAPPGMLNLLAVLPPDATGDYANVTYPDTTYVNSSAAITGYSPQPFACEVNEDGAGVIYTNQQFATIRYTALVTDTTKFTPLFVTTLSWYLAADLAGPVIKGNEGKEEAKRCIAIAEEWLSRAQAADATQRRSNIQPVVGWMAKR